MYGSMYWRGGQTNGECHGEVRWWLELPRVSLLGKLWSLPTRICSNIPAIREQLVQGSQLQSLIVRAAAQYGALRARTNDNTGRCKCAGGPANVSCVGCEPVPIHQTYKRAAGLDGRDGTPGDSIQTTLAQGFPGQAGTGT